MIENAIGLCIMIAVQMCVYGGVLYRVAIINYTN